MNSLDTPICRLYALRLGDNRVVHYEVMDVVYLIELGILQPDSFIYCYSSRKWKKARELKAICEKLSTEARTRQDQSYNPKPEFAPPPPPMSPYYSLHDNLGLENVSLEEITSLRERVEHFQQELSVKQNEYDCLQSELKIWQENYADIKAKVDHKPVGEEKLEAKVSLLEKELKTKEESGDDLGAKVIQLKKRLKDAAFENKKLAKALMALSKENKKIREYSKDLENQLNGALKGRENLKRDLRQKEGDLLKMQKREAQAKKLLRKLSKEREKHEVQKEVELNRLIGESYEVDNNPMWMIKRDGEVKGPYRFSDVMEWYGKGHLNKQTYIRKISEKVFSRIEKIYEFNTKIFTQVESKNNKINKRYFVKRTDFRAPFYEKVRLTIKDQEFVGDCTSLSVGGCFIEFQKIPGPIQMNSVLECFLHAEYLSDPIDVQMIVRNISESRPFGIGCQFLDLEDSEKDSIEEFVDSYLHSRSKNIA